MGAEVSAEATSNGKFYVVDGPCCCGKRRLFAWQYWYARQAPRKWTLLKLTHQKVPDWKSEIKGLIKALGKMVGILRVRQIGL
jgi:hypothetical protein